MSAMRLPNFFIIGAARAGTSSLYFYLKEHPEVFMCPDKEPQYFGFSGTQRADKAKYPDLASYAALFSAAGDACIVGEATPTYLAIPEAAAAIRNTCPDARLLASLRNPIDRAFSYYEMARAKGNERARSFEDWIGNNEFWLRGGCYHEHLVRYRKLFDADRLKIILFDDLANDAAATLRSVHEFLGVAPQLAPASLAKYNSGGAPRGLFGGVVYRATTNRALNRAVAPLISPRVRRLVHSLRGRAVQPSRMLPATRSWLTDFFAADIQRTQELIGRDLSHWLLKDERADSLTAG